MQIMLKSDPDSGAGLAEVCGRAGRQAAHLGRTSVAPRGGIPSPPETSAFSPKAAIQRDKARLHY